MCYLNFATKAANRRERSQQWQGVTDACLAELDDDREASIRRCNLGELRLCTISLGRHRLESALPPPAKAEEGLVKFAFQEEGECVIEQGDRRAIISAGQWYAVDKTLPYRIHANGASRHIAMSLPRRRIARWQEVSHRLIKPQGFLRGTGQVLHSSAVAAICAGAVLGRADRARLGEALVNLLNAAWHAEPPAEPLGTRRRRRLDVVNFVEQHLADPDLNVTSIARALGYSKRALHQLFVDDVTTVSRMIWERRLERCRGELIDPARIDDTITDIAHRWGFGDSQHFSKSFRARFGTCPRSYRKSHLGSSSIGFPPR